MAGAEQTETLVSNALIDLYETIGDRSRLVAEYARFRGPASRCPGLAGRQAAARGAESRAAQAPGLAPAGVASVSRSDERPVSFAA